MLGLVGIAQCMLAVAVGCVCWAWKGEQVGVLWPRRERKGREASWAMLVGKRNWARKRKRRERGLGWPNREGESLNFFNFLILKSIYTLSKF